MHFGQENIEGRVEKTSTVIIDGRTMQRTPQSGLHAGFDGANKGRGRKVHRLAYVIPANKQDHAQVAELAEQVQRVTGGHVQVAFADVDYSGEQPVGDAAS